MPRPSKFTVLKLARPGGRSLFRIVIPARFTAEGKRKAVYYQTAAAAEADARTLRAMHTQGTIGLLSLLTPEQVKDARAALDALHAAGLNLTLTEAAAVAARHSKAVRGGVSVAELLARYEQEAGTSRAWRPSTRTSWRRFARPMTEALGSTPCAELTTAALLDWLRAAFPSAQAFNGAHRTLAGAFAWAVKQRLAEENPFARIDKISTPTSSAAKSAARCSLLNIIRQSTRMCRTRRFLTSPRSTRSPRSTGNASTASRSVKNSSRFIPPPPSYPAPQNAAERKS